MTKVIGLIDCDVLIYRTCYKSIKDGTHLFNTFDDILDGVQKATACDEYEIHLSGKGNFRKDVKSGFTREYKGKRKSKPDGYHALRDYVIRKYDTITVPLFEADDTIAMAVNRIDPTDDISTIISVDKDLIQCGGLFFNTQKGNLKVYSLKQGCEFFNKQLLMGDAVDNIEGIFGMGEKKTEKLFEGKDLKQQLEAVIEKYSEVHKENAEEVLNFNGCMLWLKRDFAEPNWTIERHFKYIESINE